MLETISLGEIGWKIIFYKLNVNDRMTGNDGELLV
jgi:hypothetical protein